MIPSMDATSTTRFRRLAGGAGTSAALVDAWCAVKTTSRTILSCAPLAMVLAAFVTTAACRTGEPIVSSGLQPAQASTCLPDGYVDRLEGRWAVVVTPDGRVLHEPAGTLREGDVIRGGRRDPAATAELRAGVASRRKRLSEDEPEGDLEL